MTRVFLVFFSLSSPATILVLPGYNSCLPRESGDLHFYLSKWTL